MYREHVAKTIRNYKTIWPSTIELKEHNIDRGTIWIEELHWVPGGSVANKITLYSLIPLSTR